MPIQASYLVQIEPCTERRDGHMMNFRASCPSVPGAKSLGLDEDHALAGLTVKLGEALHQLFREGKDMPQPDRVWSGQLMISAPFFWHS